MADSASPAKGMTRRAVFLDRDGVLNREISYLHRVEDLEWIAGARKAVRKLNEAGLLVLVLTNQAGIAHGFFDEQAVERLHQQMQEMLAAERAHVDQYYYCPYHPHATVESYRKDSPWRKPGTGMIDQAVDDWNVDPSRSFLVGDKNTDIEAGLAAGVTTILVETGYGQSEKHTTRAHHVRRDVDEAADLIIELCSTNRSKTA